MAKKKKMLLILGIVLLVVGLGVALGLLALRGGADQPNEQISGETATYTIEVKSAAGIPLKDVGLYIYEDSTLAELVAFLKTDDTGRTSFTDIARDSYVAVLDKVPTGYEAEAMYPLTGELTEIVLQTGKMDAVDVETLTYKLGDAVLDFSVTGPDGTVYTLSELFEGKKAVVLNFFYNACQPCMMEFPFLQEAYAEYSDSIAVLAMNPEDGDDASIAALQKELGVTFPMVKCGPEWKSIMQLTAYPTTVIIDRFGNICLIHKGSVPDAKTFKDAFAYFSAEEYEQKLIEKIEDLLIEAPEGTEENPTEVGGQTAFEVEVEPGQVVYHELYKVFNMYLQIQSKNAYVIYNGETYYPKNGVVGLMVSAPDTFTPAKIGIGNSGKEKEIFKVYLSALKGSLDNPYTLTLGEFETNVAAGNEQGVYYTYTPTEDGTLTLQCLSVSNGVKYGYFLYNTVTSVMHNLESDGKTDASGAVTVSVDAKKGQRIQISIGALPDSENSYPAATFKFLATFTPGEVKDVVIQKDTAYTVTILDEDNNPVPSVSMVVDVAGKQEGFTAGTDGVAHIYLPAGSYKGSIYVPDGYTAGNLSFELTEAAPNATVTVTKIRRADYTVKVLSPLGEPVPGVLVRIGQGGAWLSTDANGTVTANLVAGSYEVAIFVNDPNYVAEDGYAFAQDATELTITLNYPLGTEQNPYPVESYPFSTKRLSGGDEIYCSFAWTQPIIGIRINSPDAYIRCGEVTYGADVNGVVNYTFDPAAQPPVVLAVGNGGSNRESYAVEAIYAPGTQENPIVAENYTTESIEPNTQTYFRFPVDSRVLSITIKDPDITVFGETEYIPDQDGNITINLENATEDLILAIGNKAAEAKAFAFEVTYAPLGSRRNPEVHDGVGKWPNLKLEQGDADGYYKEFTTTKTGVFKLRLTRAISAPHDIVLTTNNRQTRKSVDGDDKNIAIEMEAGQTVLIHIYMAPDETTGMIPSATFIMTASFTEGEITPPPGTGDTEPPTTESTNPPAPPVVEEYLYTVTVLDIFGAGQKNVAVIFLKDGVAKGVVTTDKDGVAKWYTEEQADYTAELQVDETKYYYDKTANSLPAGEPNLTIRIVANVDETDTVTYGIGDNEYVAYNLYVGGTRVQLGTGAANFNADNGNNCFFAFTPTEAGTYQVSSNVAGLRLSPWGTSGYVFDQGEVGESFTFSIRKDSVPNVTKMIAVGVDGSVTGAQINIARIGEPEFSIADQPWTEWQSGRAPSDDWKSEVGLVAMPNDIYFDLSKAPAYMDIKAADGTYNLWYDQAKGYYRLNGKDGPIVLVDLNSKQGFTPLYERVNGNGQYGGSAVTRYFYDSTGKFIRKEAYTEYLADCFAAVNLNAVSEKGYYPLTKDLMYVLQNGFCGWWDSNNPNYLEGFAEANPDYAWMFACCYVPK